MIRAFLVLGAIFAFFISSDAKANVCGSGSSKYLVPDYVGFNAKGERTPYQRSEAKKSASGLVSQRVSFVEACRTHDSCYGTSGTRKSTCDTAFYRDLLSACRSSLPKTAPEQMRRSCFDTAALFNDVVRGQDARRRDIWGAVSYPFTGQTGCEAYRAAQGNKNAVCE